MKITSTANKQLLINRLKRAEGQIRAVQGMLNCNKECADVAAQLSACKNAINQTLGAFVSCAIEEAHAKGRKTESSEEITKLLKLII